MCFAPRPLVRRLCALLRFGGARGGGRTHLRHVVGGNQSFFSLSALLSQVEVCWIIGRDYPTTLTFSLSNPPPTLPSVHLIEMLHSCAHSAYPVRASTLRNLGSVTPWDGSDAASNTYFYVIRNNCHRMNVFVQLWLGILQT